MKKILIFGVVGYLVYQGWNLWDSTLSTWRWTDWTILGMAVFFSLFLIFGILHKLESLRKKSLEKEWREARGGGRGSSREQNYTQPVYVVPQAYNPYLGGGIQQNQPPVFKDLPINQYELLEG